MSFHGRQTPDDGVHGPFAWIFADETARLAFTVSEGFPAIAAQLTAADVHRIGLELDTGLAFRLKSIGPEVWQAVASGGVTDHGALTGLGDNDHTQYILVGSPSDDEILVASGGAWVASPNPGGGVDLSAKSGLTDTAAGLMVVASDPAEFDIKDSQGQLTDYTDPENPEKYDIAWTGLVDLVVTLLASQTFTAVYIENTGTPASPVAGVFQESQLLSDEHRRDKIFLGYLVHSNNTSVQDITLIPIMSFGTGHDLDDLWEAIGDFNLSGHVYGANGTPGNNLHLDRTPGTVSGRQIDVVVNPDSPNRKSAIADLDISAYTGTYRSAPTVFSATATTDIDPDRWNNTSTNTLDNVAVGKWTIKRLIFGPRTGVNFFEYGQKEYNNLADAIDGISENGIDINPLLRGLVHRGWVVHQQGTSDNSTAVFREKSADIAQGSGFGTDASAIHVDIDGEIVAIAPTTLALDDSLVFEDKSNSDAKGSTTPADILALASSFPIYVLTPRHTVAPLNSDWAVNAFAELADDSNNAALQALLFDDSAAEGAGFEIYVPVGAANMTVELVSRAEVAPGAALVVKPVLYEREIRDNLTITAWSSKVAITDVSLPSGSELPQKDSVTKTLAAWGLVEGGTHQLELVRDTVGNTYLDDWALLQIILSFT